MAINIPAENAEHFRRFLAGEDPPELQHALFGRHEFADEEYESMAIHYREILREVDAIEGVEWAFIGTPQSINDAGELALDQHARNIVQIRRKNPRAKILVFDEPELGFYEPTSRIDLTYVEDNSKRLSLAQRVSQEIGEDVISCILALDTGDRFDRYVPGNDEIGEFCQRHGIITSFGMHVRDTILADKPFDDSSGEGYQEAWDGLIVFVPKDEDDDREHADEPDPSFGKKLSPQDALV